MSWREHLPVHPSADAFPLMPKDELRDLAEDIKTKGGLKSGVTLCLDACHVEMALCRTGGSAGVPSCNSSR
jgi:hypothetical protein